MSSQQSVGVASDGEALVAAYLRQRRIRWEYEAPTGGRHPDFWAHHPIQEFVMEVYEPEIRLPAITGPRWFSSYPALRRSFESRKKKQATAAREAGVPFVLTLAGTRADIGIDPALVAGAMFGDLGVQFKGGDAVEPAAEPGMRNVFLSGARLQPLMNRGVSGVAVPLVFNPTRWKVEASIDQRLGSVGPLWLAQMSPAEVRRRQNALTDLVCTSYQDAAKAGSYDENARVVRMVVLHNPHAQWPLSREVFTGAHDEQWWQEPDGSYGPRVWGALVHEAAVSVGIRG